MNSIYYYEVLLNGIFNLLARNIHRKLYGLKRVSQTPLLKEYNSSRLTQLVPSMIEERRKLSKLQKLVSLFEVTGVSFVSEKLNYCYEVWYTKYVTNQLNTSDTLTTQENVKIK